MKSRKARTARRALERTRQKLSVQREKLFALETGGSAERPLEVASPAVVETYARTAECPSCGAQHDLEEHAAVTVSGVRLRQAKLRCRQCGARRSLWFRIVGNTVN